MPELTFVLPHWVYWIGLILFPAIAMFIFRRKPPTEKAKPVSLALGYFLLVCGGFIGVHRLYVKSYWALIFIVLFTSILIVNVEVRASRESLSSAHNFIKLDEFKVERAQKAVNDGRPDAEQKLTEATQQLEKSKADLKAAEVVSDDWDTTSSTLGAIVLVLLLIDAILLPKLVRERNAIEHVPSTEGFHCPAVEAEYDDSREPLAFNRFIAHINGLVGELVAYWSVIAVFVYYYEVMARYVFNSPTNWAHESMFLMFGMQYLLAGGFVMREGAHVRVDVIYNRLPNRGKAIVDVFTSVFFFIFTLTLLFTGWTFFYDAYQVSEVSFTEWAIQYWPIKFSLPLGAALLTLQGISQLIKDIAIVINPSVATLDTQVRPEA